jgi:hypothetical protein
VLISEAYRKQQETLHKDPNYGVASVEFAPLVAGVMNHMGVTELLDYGAGKMRLWTALNEQGKVKKQFSYRAYEPADPKHCAPPKPADMVACIDVLEHVEPECLDAVLDDLKRLTLRVGLFTVHTEPAKKTLPDGRNAHLIQRDMCWWLPKFAERFDVQTLQKQSMGFSIFAVAK